ncbi:S-methyl-5-thioribose kinase [Terrisporobacter mayombei]|uniref:S-methyl-5-thioribose kinase n=1 Tax=Terrisporobacter mayombei TaxID=1541 RepID=A0ABY9PWG9_9FIRM|nr:S-methyl-5-thioribose kinase [Terrisporobacter mayombei]MCC3867896.1 S-methyl-5-thioribose kinase [Terrisporobacter mayombei]WMT80030.1 5-deoxyribose kinase [Terrisporobacter mayombei]
MEKYLDHFLMNTNTAKEYAKDKLGYFQEESILECIEIGDGNINYVFKVWEESTGKSIIIKQADKFLRSSGRPLDVYRNKIEAEILMIEGKLAKEFVPKVFHYDENMCALSMEDISQYKNLRTELMQGKTFDCLADSISTFLVNTLLPTTDLVIDRATKKQYVKLFTNIELCDISEDLVFTEPYYDYKGRNIILDENKEFVEEFLYNDDKLKKEVAILRDKFMNQTQALIHGDLHSGSIFINKDGLKVIDPEFAFYGPMGYDIGNVIGNLFFAWANKYYTDRNNEEFFDWISSTIEDTINLFTNKFSEKYDDLVTFDLYNKHFKEDYIKRVLSDSFGYAGTEIIRRVVGDSKVIEVTSVEDINKRLPMERSLIKMGISLVNNRDKFLEGKDVVREFELVLS